MGGERGELTLTGEKINRELQELHSSEGHHKGAGAVVSYCHNLSGWRSNWCNTRVETKIQVKVSGIRQSVVGLKLKLKFKI